jgi:RHS repeat-associated protein
VVLQPYTSWRGVYVLAVGELPCVQVDTMTGEMPVDPGYPNPPVDTMIRYEQRCHRVDLPGLYTDKMLSLPRHQIENGPAAWHGSLLLDQRDASGTLYRRNRYYDPSSGRFTQEDPIGLAGGVNLYGFANGDPVSYDDPYGLFAMDGDPPTVLQRIRNFFNRLPRTAQAVVKAAPDIIKPPNAMSDLQPLDNPPRLEAPASNAGSKAGSGPAPGGNLVRGSDGKWYRITGGGGGRALMIGGAVGGAGLQILLNPTTAAAANVSDVPEREPELKLEPLPLLKPTLRPRP